MKLSLKKSTLGQRAGLSRLCTSTRVIYRRLPLMIALTFGAYLGMITTVYAIIFTSGIHKGPNLKRLDCLGMMQTKNLLLQTTFTGYSLTDRLNCETFQAVACALQPYIKTVRALGNATFDALTALATDKEQYCRIYFCEVCGEIYHADYSANSDPDHDYHRECQPERSVRRHG
jgi:hypothetical protein